MYIEGKNAIRQALESKITINKIMVDKNIQGRKDEIINLAVQNKIKFDLFPKLFLIKNQRLVIIKDIYQKQLILITLLLKIF